MRNRVEIPTSVTAELTTYLAEWRRTHKAPTPLPEAIWCQAERLAAEYGIHQTARALGVGYATLRKRVAPTTLPGAALQSPPAFVEWLPPLLNTLGECTLEVESVDGRRLRAEVKTITPNALATILREFCQ